MTTGRGLGIVSYERTNEWVSEPGQQSSLSKEPMTGAVLVGRLAAHRLGDATTLTLTAPNVIDGVLATTVEHPEDFIVGGE